MEEILNSCRVCRDTNPNELESLYCDEYGTLSMAGVLYEESLNLQIDVNFLSCYPQFLCHNCEDHMKSFEKLKAKAFETLENLQEYFNVKAIDQDYQQAMALDEETPTPTALEEESSECKEELSLKTDTETIEVVPSEGWEIFDEKVMVVPEIEIVNPDEHNPSIETNEHIEIHKLEPLTEEEEELIDEYDPNGAIAAVSANFCEMPVQNEREIDDSEGEYLDVHYLESIDTDSTDHGINKKSIGKCKENRRSNYYCSPCEIDFGKRYAYMNHRKEVHGNRYPCTLCGKQLRSADALRVHRKLHQGDSPYKCDLCEKTFNQKVHYTYHMNKHNNVRDHKCHECGKGFLSKADLSIHTRIHTGYRPYPCDICDKKFLLLEHMKMHRFKHFDKSFECETCKQKFVSPSTLRTHQKTLHSNEPPQFKCSFCSRQFRRKHHLMAHHRVHQKHTEEQEALLPDAMEHQQQSDDYSISQSQSLDELHSSQIMPVYAVDEQYQNIVYNISMMGDDVDGDTTILFSPPSKKTQAEEPPTEDNHNVIYE